MMKKIFTYITALIALAACTNDDSLVGLNNNLNPTPDSIPYNMTGEDVVGIRVEIEEPRKVGEDDMSRASLVYDDDRKVMAFKWADDDVIGVFTYPDAEHSAEQMFTQVHNEFDTDLFRTFETPEHSLTVDSEKKYLACFPYFSTHTTNYSNIPVSFLKQQQNSPVDFSNYFNNKKDTKYKDSQKLASAHLSDYDYLCTGPTIPGPSGQIYFHLNRMGAIVRFWIEIGSGDGTDAKDNYVYDELQLVNNTKMFTTDALMDAAAMTLTPTAQSHVVTLKLGESGFDMTEQSQVDGLSETPFYDYYKGKFTGYIMAYMMLAPIDLKGTSETKGDPGYVENSILYLVAHEKDSDPVVKHYYKAVLSTKPNLKPNDYYQWSPNPDADTPIEFTPITVEEWREGTTFTNDGKGTETW